MYSVGYGRWPGPRGRACRKPPILLRNAAAPEVLLQDIPAQPRPQIQTTPAIMTALVAEIPTSISFLQLTMTELRVEYEIPTQCE